MYARIEMLLGALSLTAGFLALMYLFPEEWWTDRRFNMPRRSAFSSEVMLVGLDERYAERYGYGPTSPHYLASVVRASLAYDPTVIALDFRFSEAESAAPGMDSLAAAVLAAKARGIPVVIPTVLATWQGNTEVVRSPPRELEGHVLGGFIGWDMPGGRTSGLSEARVFPAAEALSPPCHALSLPAAAVAAHRRAISLSTPGCLGLGTVHDSTLQRLRQRVRRRVRDPRSVPLYFAGSVHHTRDLAFYSSERLREDAAVGTVSPSMLNKLVLIAALYPHPDGQDAVSTPFGPARGGLVHLYAIDTLLRDRVPVHVGRLVTLLIAALLAGTIYVVWQRWQARAWLVSVSALIGYVALGFVLFPAADVLLPISGPLWAGLFAAAVGFIVYGEEAPTGPQKAVERPSDAARQPAGAVPCRPHPRKTPARPVVRSVRKSGPPLRGWFVWIVTLWTVIRPRRRGKSRS
jgi:CHASE2 domain-containing sensor protein